jgi:2-succinyl-6-hydroxy-2,4-cyclohexadiene-1-carboxylate synthase
MKVVLLHGFLGCHHDWRVVMERLGEEELALDLPGHGDNRESPMAFASLLKWLVCKLPDRVHLVGYSMGGRIAQHYAHAYPERVKSLTVVSASPGIEGEKARAMRRKHDANWARKLRTMPIADFLDAWYEQPVFASLKEKPDLLAAIKSQRATGDAALLAEALINWGQGTIPSLWLTPLDVPRQWIFGAQDTAYMKMARSTEHPLPGDIHIINHAGHTVHLEQPALLADTIKSFVKEYDA